MSDVTEISHFSRTLLSAGQASIQSGGLGPFASEQLQDRLRIEKK